jgi:NADH-quinone oxidoreductase subunit C
MSTLESLLDTLKLQFPGVAVELLRNEAPSAQHSWLVAPKDAIIVAQWLRDEAGFDYCSNVAGVDWPNYLEVVYHLYSMEKRLGPVVLRMRTEDRDQRVHLPSLTPVWRSAEFQEREVFDLFGIHFDGHGDLRRILMWDGFEGHPMRRDYMEPDDYEYEPTAHGDIAEKARKHAAGGAE